MRTGMLLTAGAVLLATAACSRRDEPPAMPGVEVHRQTGVLTGPGGIQANGASATGECLSPEDARRPPSDFPPEQRRQIVGCINAQLARQVNPQLPRMIDEITRLDRLSTEGSMLSYSYTVMRPASTLPANAAQLLEQQSRSFACSQPATRQTIQMGGAYGYRWVDSQGALIHQVRIDAC